MTDHAGCRVAILYSRDRETAPNAAHETGRFRKVFEALSEFGMLPEPALYHDDSRDEIRRQLLRVDGVLVWVNPIEDGRDRSLLDATLRDVAAAGVFVSAHPDVILKLGTKEVLYRTRDIGWGCETHLYSSMDQLRRELPPRLAAGEIRVLKQYRGNGGNGVWKVELATNTIGNPGRASATSSPDDSLVRARHAKRGCVEEVVSLGEFLNRCEAYFSGDGRMIDQAYQPRLPEGMIRCYLVHDRVAGFGYQATNASVRRLLARQHMLRPSPPPACTTRPPGLSFSLSRVISKRSGCRQCSGCSTSRRINCRYYGIVIFCSDRSATRVKTLMCFAR